MSPPMFMKKGVLEQALASTVNVVYVGPPLWMNWNADQK
jgi:hypothetical protein